MPLLAISPRFFHPLFSRYHNALLEFDGAAKILIPYQHLTFIPLLMFAKFGRISVLKHKDLLSHATVFCLGSDMCAWLCHMVTPWTPPTLT